MPLVFTIVKSREERYAAFVADVRRSIAKWRREQQAADAMLMHHVDLLAEAATNFDEMERRLAQDSRTVDQFFAGSGL